MDFTHLPKSVSTLELRIGTTHLGVWEMQNALKSLSYELEVDGVFGPQTDRIVRQFQKAMLLVVDGRYGRNTHRTVVQLKCQPLYDLIPSLPGQIVESVVGGETSFNPGQLNWSSPGGVDVLTFQRHVYAIVFSTPWPDYDASFDPAAVKRAAQIGYQARLLADNLKAAHGRFYGRPGAQAHERAYRLAIYSHNSPARADTLSLSTYSNLSNYWKTPQKWVVDLHSRFEDGTPVATPYQQAQFYALGAPEHNHEGIAARLVDWSKV